MGKRKAKHKHTDDTKHIRETNRIRLTVLYLLRQQLDKPVNPDSLEDPQPLTKLDVIYYLNNVVGRQDKNDGCKPGDGKVSRGKPGDGKQQ